MGAMSGTLYVPDAYEPLPRVKFDPGNRTGVSASTGHDRKIMVVDATMTDDGGPDKAVALYRHGGRAGVQS